MYSFLLPRQFVFDDLCVPLLSESVTEAVFHDQGHNQLTLYTYEEKAHARGTICTFLEHSVFQKLRDNLFPRLEHEFILVCVPLPPAVYFEGFLDVVINPPNVQDDIILSFFDSTFILRLVKLQLIDFLCRYQQTTFEETKLRSKFSDLGN